jgi:hypothetical protein
VLAVFDTNTVVSSLLFRKGRLAWLRSAWASGAAVPIVCKSTVQELIRVLAYPKFDLTREEIDQLLGDLLPFAEVHAVPRKPWPDCRDDSDRIFLALAEQSNADALVTGDSDLLELAGSFDVPILKPADLRHKLIDPV